MYIDLLIIVLIIICAILFIRKRKHKSSLLLRIKKHKVLIIIIAIILLVYGAMLVDTNSVMNQVKDTMLLYVDPAETAGKPIEQYNYYVSFYGDLVTNLGRPNLFMVRLCVLHNFKDGYICSCYWYRLYDDKGGLISAWWAPTIWEIHKEDGEWEITKIFEGESI